MMSFGDHGLWMHSINGVLCCDFDESKKYIHPLLRARRLSHRCLSERRW